MARLWVGGLEVGVSERDLEDEVQSAACLLSTRPSTTETMPPAAVQQVWAIEERVGSAQGKHCV